jgi:hypothetical protein
MGWMIQRINHGEMLPWGYGRAWRDYERFQSVVMPIPINIIVGGLRSLYFRMVGYESYLDKATNSVIADEIRRGAYFYGQQRPLVADFANDMEERFSQFDGEKGVDGELDTMYYLNRASQNLNMAFDDATLKASTDDVVESMIDAANFLAIAANHYSLKKQGAVNIADILNSRLSQ